MTAVLVVLVLLIAAPFGLAYLFLQGLNYLLRCVVEFLVYLGD